MTKNERLAAWFGDVLSEETDLRRNALYSLCELSPKELDRAVSSLSFLAKVWNKSEEEPTKDGASITIPLSGAEEAGPAIELINRIYREAHVGALDSIKDKIDELREKEANPVPEENSVKDFSRPRVCFFCRHHVKEVIDPEYADINPCAICWDGKSFSKFEAEKIEQ